jgi:hypothetical protein
MPTGPKARSAPPTVIGNAVKASGWTVNDID